MRRLLSGLGLVVVLSAVSAVSASCSSSDSGPAAVSTDQACTDYAAAVCDKLSSCISIFIVANLGDLATCNTRYKAQCMGTANAPSTSATGSTIEACSAAAKTANCEDLLNNKLPDACTPKPGGLADGQACGDDSQCKSAFCSYDKSTKTCGVCAEAPAPGAACADGAKCGPGYVCSTSKKCAAAVAAGGACDGDKPCGTGLSCVSGVCAKWLGEGAPCGAAGQASCDAYQSLFCIANKCTKTTFVNAGEACGADVMGTSVTKLTLCAKAGNCANVDMTTHKGVCAAAAADGAACSTTSKCVEPAICSGGVCKLPDPASCK